MHAGHACSRTAGGHASSTGISQLTLRLQRPDLDMFPIIRDPGENLAFLEDSGLYPSRSLCFALAQLHLLKRLHISGSNMDDLKPIATELGAALLNLTAVNSLNISLEWRLSRYGARKRHDGLRFLHACISCMSQLQSLTLKHCLHFGMYDSYESDDSGSGSSVRGDEHEQAICTSGLVPDFAQLMQMTRLALIEHLDCPPLKDVEAAIHGVKFMTALQVRSPKQTVIVRNSVPQIFVAAVINERMHSMHLFSTT